MHGASARGDRGGDPSYTRGVGRPDGIEDDGGELRVGASAAKRPSLRRGLLGYRRDDVHQALDARDAEVAELRQDVAALWLAFGQHDRMIRNALEQGAAARPTEPPRPVEKPATPPAPTVQPAPTGPAVAPESITRQLSELDDVLAAIETATQSLERSYADEIAPEAPGKAASADDSPPPRAAG